MAKKILLALTTIAFVILPFGVGALISKYSPYTETNSFQTYVAICSIISAAFAYLAFGLMKYFTPSFERILIGGACLFVLAGPITGIVGLASAPDLSLKMLEHPEREHLRYIFLFIAAALFGVFTLLLFSSNLIKDKRVTRWIMVLVLSLALVEFIWEFTHHYFYPEALSAWVNQGKNAEEFKKNYDNFHIITIGVIGRLLQFTAIIWISLFLYKLRYINIWFPIITVIFSVLGMISASVIYITEMNLPKGFEILFLFFIPGIPFLLLYWIGVALLTKTSGLVVSD